MPDWRKPKDYCFPADFKDYYWAWEFLRRNPDYVTDWQGALERFTTNTGEFAENDDPLQALMTRGAIFVGEFCEDPEHRDFYLPVDEKDKWSLGWGLVNPRTDAPRFLSFAAGFGGIHFFKQNYPVRLEVGGKRYPWAPFDLSLPIKPQIEAVTKSLKDLQKRYGFNPRRIKHHRSQWPHYLRLLDAALDSRTPKQIADTLQAEEDGLDERKVWDRLQAARRMTRPEGYLTIFLSKP